VAALVWAAAEAMRTDADLVVVHAWMPSRAPVAQHEPDLCSARSAIRQTVVDWVLDVLNPSPPGPRVRIEVRVGRPVSVLVTAARRADALVLGYDDTENMPHRISVRGCLAAARVPVIVVRTSDGAADRHPAALHGSAL
jgi:hypothetical protein